MAALETIGKLPFARVPGVKRLGWAMIEAAHTRQPGRYLRGEFGHPGDYGCYDLRAGGHVCVRHRTGDIDIFRKFWCYHDYEAPRVIRERLPGRLDILDMGANIGMFGVWARQRFNVASYTAIEPDPDNAKALRHVSGDFTHIDACASTYEGVASFASGKLNFSRLSESGNRTVAVVDAFEFVRGKDLVKMNIEGAEWRILADKRFAETRTTWIIEYHRINEPVDDIHAHVDELLARAGYEGIFRATKRDNGLVWAYRS